MLTIKNLYKKFGQKEILHGISFSVKKGEIVGLLGPNGAGKTTIMRIITGFLSPSKGKVVLEGREKDDHFPQKKSFFGYLPENNPLYSFFTPYEYLQFIKEMKAPAKQDEEIGKIMKICGLTEVAENRIEILSRGYKQRVGLAAALIADPPLLILDEPTTGLDPNQRKEIKKLIKSLRKTTLFSSHVLPEVSDLCQKVVIINQGNLVAQGKINQLTRQKGVSLIAVLTGEKISKKKIDRLQRELQKEIKGKISFRKIGDKKIKLEIKGLKRSDSIKNKLWQFCQKNSWQIYELKEKRESLDEVFQKLTQE